MRNLTLNLVRSGERWTYNDSGGNQKVENSGQIRFAVSFDDLASNWPADEKLDVVRQQGTRLIHKDGKERPIKTQKAPYGSDND